MIYKDRDNGKEHILREIAGTDFKANKHGEVFIVDEKNGYCCQVTALFALQSVLRRKNQEDDYCPACRGKCLRPLFAHSDEVKNLWDGWIDRR